MNVRELIEALQQYPNDMEIEVVERIDGFKSRIVEYDTVTYDKPFLQLVTDTCKNGRNVNDTACPNEVRRKIRAAVRRYVHPDCEIAFQSKVG